MEDLKTKLCVLGGMGTALLGSALYHFLKPAGGKKAWEVVAEEDLAKLDKKRSEAVYMRRDSVVKIDIALDKGNKVQFVENYSMASKGDDFNNPMVVSGDLHFSKSNSFLPHESCIPPGVFTLRDIKYDNIEQLMNSKRYKKAGPKQKLYFDPSNVKAAIVTTDDIVPGENVILRELVMNLTFNYGVKEIWGVKYGFQGFIGNLHGKEPSWVKLQPDIPESFEGSTNEILAVKAIHSMGGNILGTSYGGVDVEKMADELAKRQINNLYVISSLDGMSTLRKLDAVLKFRKMIVGVIVIPKSACNDLPLLDKAFGFDTAVEVGVQAIQSADIEARSAEYGVGIVTLCGISSGYLALHSSLANRDVNICLVPEIPADLRGEKGVLKYVLNRLKTRHHCVIVISEGSGKCLRDTIIPKIENIDITGVAHTEEMVIFYYDKKGFCNIPGPRNSEIRIRKRSHVCTNQQNQSKFDAARTCSKLFRPSPMLVNK